MFRFDGIGLVAIGMMLDEGDMSRDWKLAAYPECLIFCNDSLEKLLNVT